jgi:hypothetical protein
MVIHGRVENGVVVLNDGVSLPNGSEVTVIVPSPSPAEPKTGVRVKLPLIPSKRPGSLHLTGDDIATLLNDDDLAS